MNEFLIAQMMRHDELFFSLYYFELTDLKKSGKRSVFVFGLFVCINALYLSYQSSYFHNVKSRF